MRTQTRTFLCADGLDEEFVEDVVLCVQEACKNAIRFSRSSTGIIVRLTLDDDALHVVVRDFGVGMAMGALKIRPATLAEHGRGLHIIRCLMDELDVRVAGGTEVRMVKRVPRPGQASAGGTVTLCA